MHPNYPVDHADFFWTVPDGAVPYTFHSKHYEYAPHDETAITFMDDDGRRDHHIRVRPNGPPDVSRPCHYPHYKFPSYDDNFINFQCEVFNKKLLGAFDVQKISRTPGNKELLRKQQLKIWRKNQIPYITFYAHQNVEPNQHFEFDIRGFERQAGLENSKTLVLIFSRQYTGRRRSITEIWQPSHSHAPGLRDLHERTDQPKRNCPQACSRWEELKIEFSNSEGQGWPLKFIQGTNQNLQM